MRPSVLLVVLFLAGLAGAEELRHEVGGHGKLRTVGQWFPDDSLYRDVAGSSALDMAGELRLKLNSRKGRWTFDAAWQLVGISADTLPLTGLPSDDRRLFDLTDVINESHNEALLHRLDRLWLGYASETTVLRFGRQALSWGNGLFYAPMDLVNPFDPAAIDTEYKVGDDMAYLQYLRADGDDVQAAWVLRRDPLTGDVEADEATIAIKYHGFAGQGEYDVLEHERRARVLLQRLWAASLRSPEPRRQPRPRRADSARRVVRPGAPLRRGQRHDRDIAVMGSDPIIAMECRRPERAGATGFEFQSRR